MATMMRSTGQQACVTSRRSAVKLSAPIRQIRSPISIRADAAAAAPAKPAGVEKSGPNYKPLRDINQIMQTLPHR